jgi:hypothetical protein
MLMRDTKAEASSRAAEEAEPYRGQPRQNRIDGQLDSRRLAC